MLKRLIAEGNVDPPPGASGNAQQQQHGHVNVNVTGGNGMNGNNNGGGDRRGPGAAGGMRGPVGVAAELGQRLGRVGSDMSRSDGSPLTAPCRLVESIAPLAVRWLDFIAFCAVCGRCQSRRRLSPPPRFGTEFDPRSGLRGMKGLWWLVGAVLHSCLVFFLCVFSVLRCATPTRRPCLDFDTVLCAVVGW